MHWLSSFWFNYVYPSLKSNGPEAAVQTVVYGAIGLALVPVVRKWLKAERAKLEAEAKGVELEVEKIERDILRPLRAVLAFLRKIPSLRLTVKQQAQVAAATKQAEVAVKTAEATIAQVPTDVEHAVATIPDPPAAPVQ